MGNPFDPVKPKGNDYFTRHDITEKTGEKSEEKQGKPGYSRRDFIKVAGAVGAAAVAGGFLATSIPSQPTKMGPEKPKGETYKIRVGYLPATHDCMFFAAMESGIFKELGVEVEPFIFYSGGKMQEATVADKIDVNIVGSTASMFFINKGAPISIVGGHAFYGSAVNTTPDHVKDYNNRKDPIDVFRGKTVASVRLGTADGVWRGYLAAAGIKFEGDNRDMTILNLGSPGDVVAAVRGGKADSGLTWAPYPTLAELEGFPIAWHIKWIDPHSCCRDNMSDKFLKENPETAIRFLQGIAMAERDYYLDPNRWEEFIKFSDRWLRIGREPLYKDLFEPRPFLDGDFTLRLGSSVSKKNTDRFATVLTKWGGVDEKNLAMVQSKVRTEFCFEAYKRLYGEDKAKIMVDINPDIRKYMELIGVPANVIKNKFYVQA